ncbi:MAG: DMT family transporter [Paracoccaceae bacterium]|nr:DMT family transporter [Paracoccaceae bacterium]
MTRISLFDGSDRDRPGLAAGLMAVSLFVLGLQDGLVRLAGAETSLWQFQLMRSAGNLCFLLVLARAVWGTLPRRPQKFWAVTVRSVLLLITALFFFGGLPQVTLAQMGAGLYTYPIFVTILSGVLLGENVGIRRIGAVLAGATGALLILQPGSEDFSWIKVLPVGAGFSYACMVIVTRRFCRQESPVTLATGVALAYFTASTLGLAVLSAFPPSEAIQQTVPYIARAWLPLTGLLVGTAVVCSMLNVLANLGLTMAYQNAESSWLAPIDYCYLIFATLWGLVLFGDFPDGLSLLGMALIAGAGAFTAWRERQLGRTAVKPSAR